MQAFFADAWNGLAARYDPTGGPVAPYVYGAFVRFARQYITRSQKWKPRLQDIAGVADQVAARGSPSPLDLLVGNEESEQLQEALAELPQEGRTALLDYIALRSLRKLATQYGTTRYHVEELLINALGQLVVRLDARGAWPAALDRAVALARWRDGWDIDETASRLRRPASQVRETLDRLKEQLAGKLRILNGRRGGPPVSPPAALPESPSP
jgi:RNA polymerase sigma factor (sigma-70 family)